MRDIDYHYYELVHQILTEGDEKGDRTGTGTKSIFGAQLRFDLRRDFPILSLKETWWQGIKVELCWFLKGDTNIKYLVDNKVNIWNEDAYKFYLKQIGKDSKGKYDLEPMSMDTFIKRIKDSNNYEKSRVESNNYLLGDLGPVYGKQWRNWEDTRFGKFYEDEQAVFKPNYVDQLKQAIETLKTNPTSRRILVTAWNPADVPHSALPPCHLLFQFNTAPIYPGATKYWLDCQFYMRSIDVGLGLPFNIASYALLTHIVAKLTDTIPRWLVWTGGDTHIYNNQYIPEAIPVGYESIEKLLDLTPGNGKVKLVMKDFTSIDEITPDLFELEGYTPASKLKLKLST